jgi:hypothetical protein
MLTQLTQNRRAIKQARRIGMTSPAGAHLISLFKQIMFVVFYGLSRAGW